MGAFNSERKRSLGGAREERKVRGRRSWKVLGSDSREEALRKELRKSKVLSWWRSPVHQPMKEDHRNSGRSLFVGYKDSTLCLAGWVN